MLSAVVIQRIKQMLEAGDLSQRQIAREVGVSHTTVARVAVGRVRPLDGLCRERSARSVGYAAGEHARCPDCGAKVYAESLRASGLCIDCDNAGKTPEQIRKLEIDEAQRERHAKRYEPDDGPPIQGLASPIDLHNAPSNPF
jgi:Helix-turn-helix domain of resolvase.